MTGTVEDLKRVLDGDMEQIAASIAMSWDNWHRQRQGKVGDWKELRDYIFATDTSTTTNSGLPWKNRTTLPKLCQIRDNLHANYVSSLFPNDNWLRWEGYDVEDETVEKRKAITAYMQNKLIESQARGVISQLVLDFIDYGNAFASVEYVDEGYQDDDGNYVEGYHGPRIVRISPLDITFNPLAPSFESAPKIVRKLLNHGEIARLAQTDEDWQKAFEKSCGLRNTVTGYSVEDFNKASGLAIDGFGSYLEYLQSGYAEILVYTGDLYDPHEQKLYDNAEIVVLDRRYVVRKGKISNWMGKRSICHAGWRKRPDNLYAMGPLDNLVGLQYRLDHLENLKADAMDLCVHPPLVIAGDVSPFDWVPGARIFIQEGGAVQELGMSLQGVVGANNEIEAIMARMELLAGSPREAMGIRSPGEKTAFEVQTLDNAAGRIFQEKIVTFEVELLEPLMQTMLATGRQYLDAPIIVRYMDDDLGVEDFQEITKEDITARGKIRPVGARHFSQQANTLQALNMVLSGPAGGIIAPHVSGKNLARLIEDNLQISRYNLIRPNVGVVENMETQQLQLQAQEDAEVEASTPLPGADSPL